MSTLTHIPRLLTTVTLGIAAITALTISVRAQSPRINACVNQNSGETKITSADTCAPGSFLLQWNQAGPAGPAGAPGPLASRTSTI